MKSYSTTAVIVRTNVGKAPDQNAKPFRLIGERKKSLKYKPLSIRKALKTQVSRAPNSRGLE